VPTRHVTPNRNPRRRLAWAGAFTGFYPTSAAELSTFGPITRFLYAARSVILVISAQAALIAGLLAATDRRFQPVPFLLLFIAFVVLHAISNISNDYFGFRRGHDTPESPRRRYTLHPIASGVVSPRALAVGIGILGTVALLIGGYFIFLRGWTAAALAIAGAGLLWGYDAAPRALKELGLGEFAAFIVWGPLMIGGGYYVLTGTWSAAAFLAAVPYGLGVSSILVGKHIDQRGYDAGHGQRTLPVLLGATTARRLTIGMIIAMYAAVVAAVASGLLSVATLVVFLAAPRAMRALRVLSRPAPEQPPPGYIGWPLWFHRVCLVHNRLYGWLFLAGLAVGALWPGSVL
jgi:1,4-dihydroxy-2-naphthoate octaprenyltransferase